MSRQAHFHDLSELFHTHLSQKRDVLRNHVDAYVQQHQLPLGDMIYCGGETFVIVGHDGKVEGAELACDLPLDRYILPHLQKQQIKYDDILELMKDEDNWFYIFYWDETDAAEQVADLYKHNGLLQ